MYFYIIYNLISSTHYILVQNISEEYFYNNVLTPLIYFHSSYFLGDTIYEYLTEKRWLFIAHHISAVLQIGILQYYNVDFTYLMKTTEIFSLLEISALILNIRTLFKNNKILYCNFDLSFLIGYGFIRCIVFPYYIYHYLSDHIGCATIPTIIYIVSVVWTYNWYISWVTNKRYNEIRNTIYEPFSNVINSMIQ